MKGLSCPQCYDEGVSGSLRIGNRRSSCATCNAFAQAVRRRLVTRLVQEHAELAERMKLDIEAALHPRAVERYQQRKKGQS